MVGNSNGTKRVQFSIEVNALDEEQLPTLPEQLDAQSIAVAFDAAIPSDREIDASFFSHKNRKATRLVGADPSEPIKAKREWHSFDLYEPAYLTSIKVTASGYEDYHEMELSLIDALTGEEFKEKRKFSGSGFLFEPKRFVRGFGLRPDQPWSILKSQYISRIDARGLEQKSFFEILMIYENVEREKAKIEDSLSRYFSKAKQSVEEITKNSSKVSEQKTEIKTLSGKIAKLTEEVSQLSEKRDEINTRIEVGTTVEKERNERVQAIGISINNLNIDRKSLSENILKEERALKELKSEINLFPTEIAGYVGQGKKNITLYAWLSAVPMLIIAFVTYRLFQNAEKLLDFNISVSTYDVIKYLLSRSPYVAVSAAVLGICYSVIRGLFSEIVNINRRRQELFKISIIATDVSYASQYGMKLDDDKIYELKTQTKMELLKEHLKMNIGDDFVYSPRKAFSDRLKSVNYSSDVVKSEAEEMLQS